MMKANIPLSAGLRVLHHQQKATDGSVCLFVLKRRRKQKRFCDILSCFVWGIWGQWSE